MPYQNNNDLPDRVKNFLPSHAQDIYREAFNHAWDEYREGGQGSRSREETAHAVAWSAVENKFHKDSHGNWVEK
ncbi:ChaB family protein [Patescibacteria group bacterium]|nr:ChaB family protein [Patescibacteria group bacterium]